MNKPEPEMPRADGACVLQHGEAAANESRAADFLSLILRSNIN